MARIKALLDRLKASLPYRAYQRYNKLRGGVISSGIAYSGFFSLFPALAVGFTAFGWIVGDDPDLQQKVIKAVNDAVGTPVIKTSPASGGIVDISTLTSGNTLTITGIVGLAGLLLTGLGWMDSVREGIRAMFGQPRFQGNFLATKAKDLFTLATVGVLLLASVIGGFVVNSAAGTILGWIGLSGSWPSRLLLSVISTLLLLVVDVLMFMVLFNILSGVKVPRKDLWDAAVFAGIGFGLLKTFAGVLLNGASHNKFLATAGVVLVLLVWLNFVSELLLVAASWGATVALDRGHMAEGARVGDTAVLDDPEQVQASRAGAVLAGSQAAISARPSVSTRAGDRVSVAAGAVLGAAAILAVRTTASAVKGLAHAGRRDDD